jgi:UDP-2,3-diacylglucosamine pyrophosphatase LpxH
MALYVISDLHIGAGELDDCDAGCEAALVEFIGSLTGQPDVELVLNGDSFDFVQADPWNLPGMSGHSREGGLPLAHTRSHALAKARAILKAHGRVFEALGRFLRHEGARLTLMPGNHDADLFWPDVRAAMQARIVEARGPSGALPRWHLERVYRPARAPGVWIEHGHQYDPNNRFFGDAAKPETECWSEARPPVFTDTRGEERLFECIGTRFLARYLNALDRRYPFVDNIKPFKRFVQVMGSSAVTLQGGSLRAALSVLAFLRFAALETVTAPANLLSVVESGAGLGPTLVAMDRHTSGALSRALVGAGLDLRGASFDIAAERADEALRILDFALAHEALLDDTAFDLRGLLSAGAADDGNLSLGGGLVVDETAALKRAAQHCLKQGAQCVVMGHTHELVDEPAYKNTGSWTRYWQVPDEAEMPSWRQLVKDAATLPMALRCAFVPEDVPAPQVELRKFVPGAARGA